MSLCDEKSCTGCSSYGKEHYDIGIAGGWCFFNYGDEIAHYALYRVVEDMGYSALMLQWPADSTWEARNYPPMFRDNPYLSHAISEGFNTKTDLRSLNDKCDIFLTGPGQYHNPRVCHYISDMPLLDFVNNNKLKVAYSASWGHDPMIATEHEKAYFAYYMQRFDAFSVRESSAKEFARKKLSLNAEWVLDPVFICDHRVLHELADKAKDNLPEKSFIFSYILDSSGENSKFLKYYKEKIGLPLRVVTHDSYKAKLDLSWDIETLTDFYVEDWLAHFKNSEWVITDSFHGVCMALTFKKPFIAVVRKDGGVTRYYSLLEPLGLGNKIVDGLSVHYDDESLFAPIDYSAVSEILDEKRKSSIEWLKNALAMRPISNAYSAHTIMDLRVDELEKEIQKKIGELEQRMDQPRTAEIENLVRPILEELEGRNSRLQHDLNNLYISRPYRLGRTLTWLPRKIRGGKRCLEENGFQYTAKHFYYKIMRHLSD